MVTDLTSAEYAYLIILWAEGREISNTEMAELYGVRLKSPDYAKLNADGYIISRTKPSPYRHSITDQGVKALLEPLTLEQGRVPEGEKRSAKERELYWAAMLAQQKILLRSSSGSDRAAPTDLTGRVRAAYGKLVSAPGDWVKLVDLRVLLADVSKSALDKALEGMLDSPDVSLEPEPFGHRIGVRERNAAVHIGGEDRHKLAIGQS
ncbi:hypothetical protein GA0070216_13517 [Micromonospora matsumotoense]|uniref:Uncharacterized protein n=1 Tax=Micromonospora matsumotoense TaxID=121616 RepID=A0A1C5AWA9_9ACTN|nr:hypothetical protein [Micromonospora matsumotoense]SCF49509.1 hypothetical protein GA0070216_13517 [Micromonospora matsumotoense]